MNYKNDKPIEYNIYQQIDAPKEGVSSFRYVLRNNAEYTDKCIGKACKIGLLGCISIGLFIICIMGAVFVWSLQTLVKKMNN